jgi:hypothetical protein
MRNHIPKVKTLKYTKSKEEIEDTDDTRLNLIKSENPNWSYEVYRFIDGKFLGYMGEIKNNDRKDIVE